MNIYNKMNHRLEIDKPGQVYGPYDVSISRKKSHEYEKIFGISEKKTLPPIIHVVLALTKLIDDIGVISKEIETIHAGQGIKWYKPATPEKKIIAICELKSNTERKNLRFATINVKYNIESLMIGESSTTIIIKKR